MMTLDTKK